VVVVVMVVMVAVVVVVVVIILPLTLPSVKKNQASIGDREDLLHVYVNLFVCWLVRVSS